MLVDHGHHVARRAAEGQAAFKPWFALASARRWLMRMGLLCAVCCAGGGALGQDAAPARYPSRPITWIVGYPAGGGSDFLARAVAAQMSVQMGQPVVVDNRPGPGAILGAQAAARAAGDGYTVFTADNGVLVYNPALYQKLPYDPKQFAPIGLMARLPLLLVASPTSNIRNAKELLAALAQRPGQLIYASPGKGSPHHLAMELFKNETGLSALHLAHRGAALAIEEAMNGQVPLMMADTSSSMPAIKAKKLVPLVVTSAKRIPQLPDVPTMVELGYKEAEAYAWQGMVVPVSTPLDIRERLSHEMQLAISSPGVRKLLADAAWEAVPTDANLMGLYVMLETRKWAKVIMQRKITLE